MNSLKLKPKDLKRNINNLKIDYDPSLIVKNTNELIYGQERSIKAFEFGLEMDVKGYNIFFEGPTGVGKNLYVEKLLKKVALEKEVPSDYVYVYNFDRPSSPKLIELKSGSAREFKLDMEKYIGYVLSAIKKTFAAEEIEKEKKDIQSDLERVKNEEIRKLNKEIEGLGFEVQKSADGVFMLPKLEGKVLNKEEYMALPDNIKANLQKNAPEIQDKICKLLTNIREHEIEIDKKIILWQEKVGNITIKQITDKLLSKYKDNKDITKYLEDVQKDIAKNIDEILKPEEKPTNILQQRAKKPWDNYRVNVFVDNYGKKGAPVLMDVDYSFENIFGKIEYENAFGTITTDYTKIRSGILHEANGGYIVFEARELLESPRAYEVLKNALKREQIGIETLYDQRNIYSLNSIKPEAMDIKVKVILIGHSDIYNLLMYRDPDFAKLFKVKAEFDTYADFNDENIKQISKFTSSYINEKGILELDESGIKKIVEYALGLTGEKDKLTTDFAELGRMLSEANIWAKKRGGKFITAEDIKTATDERYDRIKKYDNRYNEMLLKDRILISTQGEKVGEINGLAVISIGDFRFGKPTKITANTFKGGKGIINIEREAKQSGKIHDKGVAIIGGYFGEKYAQEFPLSMTASICFEQTYNGVDGDSASSTEIYVILSSLADIPIKQNIAVTGSVNQKGEIQPIGGVNEKIKGFYEVCKLKGLKGNEGVIIPKQNVSNLHLDDEIINAVRDGKFSIWAVSNVEEGIEILTGIPAGKKNKNGKYSKGSINYLVYEKLKKYDDTMKKSKDKKEKEE